MTELTIQADDSLLTELGGLPKSVEPQLKLSLWTRFINMWPSSCPLPKKYSFIGIGLVEKEINC